MNITVSDPDRLTRTSLLRPNIKRDWTLFLILD
jgi:hypothetical protein